MKKQSLKLGAENIHWNTDFLYSSISDPKLNSDVTDFVNMAKQFHANYNGKLEVGLGKAIEDYSEITMLSNKIILYLYCTSSTNVSDSIIKTKKADIEKIFNQTTGEYLNFFQLQLIKISDEIIERMYKADPTVLKHKPWIEQIRIFRPHVLSEEVESALTKRDSFGASAWDEFFDEVETDLVFTFGGKKKSLTEMLHILSESKKSKERALALKVVNEGLGGYFSKYSAQNLYVVVGLNAVEQAERKYSNPMHYRNMSNRIPDDVVNALHSAVLEVGSPLAKRYYKLKSAHLKLKILKWSDRNAPMPFSDSSIIPFEEAKQIVLSAFRNFSPTIAGIVEKMFEEKRIDAPVGKNKKSGAYNFSVVLPGNKPVSLNFLNYLGGNGDVMTAAHELGHAAHGILAGEKQGVLMQNAPIIYAETASIFGEMTAFDFLKERLLLSGDKKSLLALIMGKIDDILNTSVRQISLSDFERQIHGMDKDLKKWNEPKKLSTEELNNIWLNVTKRFYGEEGEVFSYKDMEKLWAYISHFHRPFYVYGYAFGELLTQSLYAVKDKFGDKFEPLYLEMLRAGGTKDVVELLKPFGLDPSNPSFWSIGIMEGLGSLIKEAEKLSKELGVFPKK